MQYALMFYMGPDEFEACTARRTQHRQWRGLRALPAEAPPSGVAEDPAYDRSDNPGQQDIYLICGNYSTHKRERVLRWLESNKRFHVRLTPTSA